MNNRESSNSSHPPACTCVDCVNKRLERITHNHKHTQNSRYKPTKRYKQPINFDSAYKKHKYSLGVRIFTNIILALIVVSIISAIYVIVKYHDNAFNWASNEYHIVSSNIGDFMDKTGKSLTNVSTQQITPPQTSLITTTPTQIKTPVAQTSSILNKVENSVSHFVLWNTDVNDYAKIFNEYRQSKGCIPLTFTDDLNRIATLRLEEIKRNFSHNSIGGYNRHLAENIVEGSDNNNDNLICWENSPGHNANMLDKSYKYTGYAAGGGHAVQVFSSYTTINGEPQLPPGWHFAN